MGITKSIKSFVRNKQLALELDTISRNRAMINLHQAKRIGILYEVGDENSYRKISDLVRYLQGKGKIVKALGFVPFPLIPHYCNNMLSFDYYQKKEINWWGKPSNQFIKDFVHEEYDILIDLNLNNIPSLLYITALSVARFKVGLFNKENEKFFDFMIQIDEPSMSDYIKHLVHYLEVLNQDVQ